MKPATASRVRMQQAAECYQRGEMEAACAGFREALGLDPGNADARNNLACACRALGRTEEAIGHLQELLRAHPGHAEAWYNLGNALAAQAGAAPDWIAAAESAYRRSLALQPQSPGALFNLANLLRENGRAAEALPLYVQTLRQKPRYAEAAANLGSALKSLGQHRQARVVTEQALAMDPNNDIYRFNLALLQLLEGDFAAGWPNFEARLQMPAFDFLRGWRLWQGEPLCGQTLVVLHEQGLGDTMQMLRFFAFLPQDGRILLRLPPRLHRLAASLRGFDALLSTEEAIPAAEYVCPLMSLPRIFGVAAERIPGRVPYLEAPAEARRKAERIDGACAGLRVGLCWSGNPGQTDDRNRSIPLERLTSLLEIPGVRWFSLQIGEAARQLEPFRGRVIDLAPETDDMADTAAQIERLDLVLTVDTSVAHLAGAMGKPVWILLPFVPDWRWGLHRADSPWYPSARLFRQPRAGDWAAAVAAAGLELHALTEKTHRA